MPEILTKVDGDDWQSVFGDLPWKTYQRTGLVEAAKMATAFRVVDPVSGEEHGQPGDYIINGGDRFLVMPATTFESVHRRVNRSGSVVVDVDEDQVDAYEQAEVDLAQEVFPKLAHLGLESDEPYDSHSAAIAVIEHLWSLIDSDHTTKVQENVSGEWYWSRVASNGEVIATSGEGYNNKSHAVDMAVRLNPGTRVIVDGDDD